MLQKIIHNTKKVTKGLLATNNKCCKKISSNIKKIFRKGNNDSKKKL